MVGLTSRVLFSFFPIHHQIVAKSMLNEVFASLHQRRCLCNKSQEISYERFQVLSPQVIACNPFSNHLGWTFSSSTWLSKPHLFRRKEIVQRPKIGRNCRGKVSIPIPILQKGLRHGRSSKPLVFFHGRLEIPTNRRKMKLSLVSCGTEDSNLLENPGSPKLRMVI